jgi:hypothetical protein
VNSSKLTDQALLKRYEKARAEVHEFLQKRQAKQEAA